MNSSAIASRSIVDMPARATPRSICTVAPRIRPPSAMMSISRALLSWITSSSGPASAHQRAERACGDVLHATHGIDHGDSRAVRTVPLQHWRGLPLVDGEPVADRLGLVVLPAHEAAAVLVARAARLAPGVRRLADLAHGSRRQPTHDLLVIDVEAEHRVHLATELLAHLGQPF